MTVLPPATHTGVGGGGHQLGERQQCDDDGDVRDCASPEFRVSTPAHAKHPGWNSILGSQWQATLYQHTSLKTSEWWTAGLTGAF